MSEQLTNLSILSSTPANIAADGNIQELAKIVTAKLLEAAKKVNLVLIIPNLDTLDSDKIDELAWQYHVDTYSHGYNLEVRRNLVRQSLAWHKLKGTPDAVKETVTAICGNCTLTEWMDYNGNPYYFRVSVATAEEADIHAVTLAALKAIAQSKNARSHLDGLYLSYPTIELPSENPIIYCETFLTMNITHITWNVGSAAIVRLDAKYNMDGSTKLDALDPRNGYSEKQVHIMSEVNEVNIAIKNTRINLINGSANLDGAMIMDGEHITSYTVSNKASMTVIPLASRPHTYGGYHNYDGSSLYAWPYVFDGAHNYDGSVIAGFDSGDRADQSYNTGPNYYDGTMLANGAKRYGWTDCSGKGGTIEL